MRAAILKKILERPQRKLTHNRSIQIVGRRHIYNRDYTSLAGDFVHAQNLEVSFGGFALFDFQVPTSLIYIALDSGPSQSHFYSSEPHQVFTIVVSLN
jgi:hypothetical protein